MLLLYSHYFILGLILLLMEFLAFNFIGIENANGVDNWNGEDTINVPISWCAISGSPAVDNPNIPTPWGDVDTNTDDILERRYERATDNIYINDTGISFRSAINDATHTTLNFPITPDPNIMLGSPGNMTLGDFQRDEYRKMFNQCKDAWQNISQNGEVNGIIAINVRLFIDHISGNVKNDIIGVGGCSISQSTGLCGFPYSGRLFVVDNYFTFPEIPSGMWNNDPLDQNLAHEIGHALGLTHRNGDDALMNEQQQHNANGIVDNIKLNIEEINKVRNNAQLIPGVEFDPDNKITQGDVIQSNKVDDIQESTKLLPYEDLSSVIITLDKKQNILSFGQELFGLLPTIINNNTQNNIQYWTLVDTDNKKETGANNTILNSIGIPPTKFSGIELAILAEIDNDNKNNNNIAVKGMGWTIKDQKDNFTILDKLDIVKFDIQTMAFETLYETIPVYNTINVILNNTDKFLQLNKPFSIQSIIYSNDNIVDTLIDESDNENVTIELKQPLYPQCFINEKITDPGKNVTINTSGLSPNSNISAVLGPRLIANSTTDNLGNSTITFTIPHDMKTKLYPITVGVNNTTLTSDCEINIQTKNKQ